jgi:hypothetical protein
MHDINMSEVTDEFARCYQAAGRHLRAQVQEGISWLKADRTPPFLEHLSFRLGNQLFFVRLEPVDSPVPVPASREGLLSIARGCNGHPCIMPMALIGGSWTPDRPGWGLVDLVTGEPIDPIALVSAEPVEMTDWELHDFAVQVVRGQIVKDGGEIMSSQGNPAVNPSIWFVKDSGPEWVVVRAARYPAVAAAAPENMSSIAEGCARLSKIGHFASVAIASSNDASDPSTKSPRQPLWRGHGMTVRYRGLERVT